MCALLQSSGTAFWVGFSKANVARCNAVQIFHTNLLLFPEVRGRVWWPKLACLRPPQSYVHKRS